MTSDDKSLDFLDYVFKESKPFNKKPGKDIQEQVDEFMQFMDFHPGSLHMCLYEFPWVYGKIEDPQWMGNTRMKLNEITIQTDPEEVFLVVGAQLIHATYKNPEKQDDWMYALKVMVRDKIVYFPLPIDQMDENSANHFKALFRKVEPDN